MKKQNWLKDAVFYQIYPQSFNDSNGDGIGDIQGIIEKLGYLESLGINAIWISPIFESPFMDAGYDVADYYKVAPRYGTNDKLKELFTKAKSKGIRILLDLVPGHTSTECQWFKESAKHEASKYDDWYIWKKSGGLDFITGYAERYESFLTNFYYCQPALNYGYANPNPEKKWQHSTNSKGPMAVKEEIKKIIKFWIDMGAYGFRVDMASSLIKQDIDNKDNNKRLKEVFRFWQNIRDMMDTDYPEAVLISEWFEPNESLEAGFHADFAGMSKFLPLRTLIGFGGEKDKKVTPDQAFDLCKEELNKAKGKGYISYFTGNHDWGRIMKTGMSEDQIKVFIAFTMFMPIPSIFLGFIGLLNKNIK
jgi:maltose alpha-D-glucosyltransferase/alpha-amylase